MKPDKFGLGLWKKYKIHLKAICQKRVINDTPCRVHCNQIPTTHCVKTAGTVLDIMKAKLTQKNRNKTTETSLDWLSSYLLRQTLICSTQSQVQLCVIFYGSFIDLFIHSLIYPFIHSSIRLKKCAISVISLIILRTPSFTKSMSMPSKRDWQYLCVLQKVMQSGPKVAFIFDVQ